MGYHFSEDKFDKFLSGIFGLPLHLESADRYINEHAGFPFANEGIINVFSSGHREAVDMLESHLNHLVDYFRDTLPGYMEQVRDLYTSHDEGGADKLRSLEGEFNADADMLSEARAADNDIGSHFPERHADPITNLREPKADPDVHIPTEPSNVLDYFSVQFAVRQIVKFCGGGDPMDWLGKAFAGNWEKFSAFADALDNVADCIDDIGHILTREADQLEEGWSGNAYASFNLSMRDIREQLKTGTVEPIRDLAQNYRDAADSMVQSYHSLEPGMGVVVDTATGIGVVSNVLKGVKKLADELLGAVDDANTLVSTARANASAQSATLTDVELVELKELGGSGDQNLLLTDDGLPVVVEKYESL